MGWLWQFFSGETDAAPPVSQRNVSRRVREIERRNGGLCCTRLAEYYATDQLELATAYHEAGHGRAAVRAGLTVRSMQVFSPDSGSDYAGITTMRGDAKSLKAALMVGIAGQEAEIRYLREYQGMSRRQAVKATHRGATGDRQIFEEVSEGRYSWSDLESEARSLVRWNWGTIETNAKKLARRGKLSGTWA